MSNPLNNNHPSDEDFDPGAIRLGCLVMLIGGVLSWAFVIWAVNALVKAIIQ